MNPYKAPTAADSMDTDATATTSGGGTGPSTAGVGQGPVQAQSLQSAWSMLMMARQLIDQGKPSLALQMVMAVMRSRGGENAVFQTLQRARELYRNKLQENAAADELASLFAECAIAEAQPVDLSHQQAPPTQPTDVGVPTPLLDAASDTSILAMSGRKQIMLDACSDGSSFICLRCGGLVSNFRKDEHFAYWCGKY